MSSTPGAAGVYRRIVVAVDGSEFSLRAAAAAVNIGKKNGARILAVTVMTVPDYLLIGGNVAPQALDQIYTESRANAQSLVDNVVKMAKDSGLEAEGSVLTDSRSVVQAIVDFAEGQGADLIVLGTRGMGNLKRALLGSVSTGVATHAHCSVLIVR